MKNTEAELLKIKSFLLGELSKGTFVIHVQDMLTKINGVLNALDSERKPS